MNIRSAKAKGRRLCQESREMILSMFTELHPDDIRVNPASCPGADLWLSPAAQASIPCVFEMKNCEKAKPWEWIDQAKGHHSSGLVPVVVFSRNHEPEPYCIISFRDLLGLMKE